VPLHCPLQVQPGMSRHCWLSYAEQLFCSGVPLQFSTRMLQFQYWLVSFVVAMQGTPVCIWSPLLAMMSPVASRSSPLMTRGMTGLLLIAWSSIAAMKNVVAMPVSISVISNNILVHLFF